MKKIKDFLGGPVLRLYLPMQGSQVQFLVQELRFHMSQGNWAFAPQLLKPMCARACALLREKPRQCEGHALRLESSLRMLQLEKACAQQLKPSAAKNKCK